MGIPRLPEGPWPLLTALAITAADTYHPLLMPGNLAQGLPSLSSIVLDHPALQAWTQPQPSVTSLVLHTLRAMEREFQDLLRSLPRLESLEVSTDSGFFPFDTSLPVIPRVSLNHLRDLKVGSSQFRILRLFTAPALRRLHYQVLCEGGQDLEEAKQLFDLFQFKAHSHLSTCLEMLAISADPSLPVLAASVHRIISGLSALQHLRLSLGTGQPYKYLHRFYHTNTVSLTAARFQVVDNHSAKDVLRFAELHTTVKSVEALWPRQAPRRSVFESPWAKAQGWSGVRPGYYRLIR